MRYTPVKEEVALIRYSDHINCILHHSTAKSLLNSKKDICWVSLSKAFQIR